MKDIAQIIHSNLWSKTHQMKHFCSSFLCRTSISDIICDISNIISEISNIISNIWCPHLTYRKDMPILVHAQFLTDELWVAGNTDDEVGMLIIRRIAHFSNHLA